MNLLPPSDALDTALDGLTVAAPATLKPAVLVEVGLLDRYARIDSPIGPLTVAWNGLGVSLVDHEPDDAAFEARHRAATGRPSMPAERPAGSAGRGHRAAARRRPAGAHQARPAWALGLRAGRLAQGPGDPPG